ncbi:polysaccharide biosynthesis protein [Chloroflexota bacterium]|nr:polysaccharide biosynthesis protein [Chloroflexota bacterium]
MDIFGRRIRNRYLLMGDIFLSLVSVMASFIIRLELFAIFDTYRISLLWMLGLVIVIKPIIYYFFGIYRRLWRYASIRELVLIIMAVSTASIIVSAIMITLFATDVFTGFPRSVLVIDWLLSILFVGGLRFIFRLVAETTSTAAHGAKKNKHQQKDVLVIGAGDAGAMVVRELQKNPQLNMNPIGFIDDDPAKLNSEIHSIKVLASLSQIDRVLETRPVDEVVIAIPSASGKILRQVADACRQQGVPFRTMPGLYELLGGVVNVSRLREVDISDLLRREQVHMDSTALGEVLRGKTVMVTGAGGSIGRELCRQIAQSQPARILLLGHGENSIFETMLELRDNHPSLETQPLIADVRDLGRLQILFERWQPEVLFHAAAHKHVPLMESNIEEAITNNILGTRNIVTAALEFDVQRLVMISTDKAIRPVNVMGATKRLAEMIVLNAARTHHKAFTVVRFGNVLGSRGSVVPRFKRQIAKGGPITITHPEMKRYFMTIPEAVHLVLQASAMSQGGEAYVLNMGEQVKIQDLAEDLIRLSGLEPNKDIEIIYTGIRPGEKLSEDLWDQGFAYSHTNHPDINQVDSEEALSSDELNAILDKLVTLAHAGKPEEILEILSQTIPGAAIQAQSAHLDMVE